MSGNETNYHILTAKASEYQHLFTKQYTKNFQNLPNFFLSAIFYLTGSMEFL